MLPRGELHCCTSRTAFVRWHQASCILFINSFLQCRRTSFLFVVIHFKNVSHFSFWCFILNLLFFLSGPCWPYVRVVKTQLGPSRLVSTAGSWCAVCGLMFSPTSLAEGALDMFISAGEAYRSNSSRYLFGRLYTALAAVCSLTCGPMCGRPHALWLRTTRLLWVQTYYETVVNYFLNFSALCVFFNVGLCTALIRVLYCMCTHCVLHVQLPYFFVSVFLLLCNLFSQCMGVHCLVNHTRNALIMVLYCTFIYFCTSLIIYMFAFFFF